jgi:hypothetical protein
MLLDTISRYSEFASSSPEASDSYSDHSMSDIEDGMLILPPTTLLQIIFVF